MMGTQQKDKYGTMLWELSRKINMELHYGNSAER